MYDNQRTPGCMGKRKDHAGPFKSVVSEAAECQAQLVCDFLADVGTVCLLSPVVGHQMPGFRKAPFLSSAGAVSSQAER